MSRIEAANHPATDPRPSAEEVREYLRFLLGQSAFNASERNRRFLSYVVEETLEGRADRIKAYSIALAAFDRSTDFDPLTDPIVRIEASRLRRALEHYYLTEGKADLIRIDIPKGSYIATFGYGSPPSELGMAAPPMAEAAMPASKAAPVVLIPKRRWDWRVGGSAVAILLVLAAALIADKSWVRLGAGGTTAHSRGPSLMVMPFENIGADQGRDFIARGLTYELIGSLTGYGELLVFGPETSFGIGRQDAKSNEITKPDYVLSGSVHATDAVVRVSAILSESRTGQYVWSTDLERDLTTVSLIELEADIAGQVAGAIAQPYGVVFNRAAAAIASKPAGNFVSYQCIVKFREYWRVYDKQQYDEVRGCLERTIEADPRYAKAYSSLALLNIDAYRFGFGGDRIAHDPLERALQMAQKAIDLDPNSSDGYLALSMAHWFSGDTDRSIQVARHGLDLNPHNSDLLGELGLRYALLAKWDESAPLIAEAYARNPAAPSGYRVASFLNAYMQGDYRAALQQAIQVKAPYVLYGHMARAIAYAQLGDSANAAASVAEILRIDPDYGHRIVKDLDKRHVDPSIIQAIVEGLAKAGLQEASASTGG